MKRNRLLGFLTLTLAVMLFGVSLSVAEQTQTANASSQTGNVCCEPTPGCCDLPSDPDCCPAGSGTPADPNCCPAGSGTSTGSASSTDARLANTTGSSCCPQQVPQSGCCPSSTKTGSGSTKASVKPAKVTGNPKGKLM